MTFTTEHEGWLENDDLFFSQLGVGRKGELKVAHALLSAGIPVQLFTQEIRKNTEDRFRFRDQADIMAGPWNQPYRIEVKHINARFSGTMLSTFPYDDVIVVTTNKWKNIKEGGNLPTCFVIVSQHSSDMLVVPCVDWEINWQRKMVRDRVRGIDIETWVIPIGKCAKMSDLVKYLSREK